MSITSSRLIFGGALLTAVCALGGCVSYSPNPPTSTTTTESTTTTQPAPMVPQPGTTTTTVQSP